MLPDRVSNPGPLTYESGALPIALRGPAFAGSSTSPFLVLTALCSLCASYRLMAKQIWFINSIQVFSTFNHFKSVFQIRRGKLHNLGIICP